jgi:hypothetical protein
MLAGFLLGIEARQTLMVGWDRCLLLLWATRSAVIVCLLAATHAAYHEEHREWTSEQEQARKNAPEELRSHHAYDQGDRCQAEEHFPIQAHLHAVKDGFER